MSLTQILCGVLAIDKPTAMTSRDVVNCIQQLLRYTSRNSLQLPVQGLSGGGSESCRRLPQKIPKLGHTGTLDPMATGVLLVVIGSATRMVEYAHHLPKTYEAEFLLGMMSDTLDSTGKVKELDSAPAITQQQLIRELENWLGTIRQIPPKYSAVHVAGRRAYELARSGSDFYVPSRQVTIHDLRLLDFEYPKFTLSVRCSTGTYIRSLGSDIATALGTDAIMSRLVRTRIGPYDLENCVKLTDLQTSQDVEKALLSPLGLLQELPKLHLNEHACSQIKQGKSLEWEPLSTHNQISGRELAVVDLQNRPVAIVKISDRLLRPVRVFNL